MEGLPLSLDDMPALAADESACQCFFDEKIRRTI